MGLLVRKYEDVFKEVEVDYFNNGSFCDWCVCL